MRSRLADIERLLRRIAYVSLRWVYDRVDRFRRSPPPFDGRLPPPRIVTIETTKYCNLSCRMCLPFLDGTTTAGPHMPMETFRRYAEMTFPYVAGFEPTVSAEPLMSKGFLEMVETARKWGLGIDVTTNATLLNERMINALVGSLRKIVISCDGATPETFEHIRAGASFERVLTNVKRLVAATRQLPRHRRPIVVFNCTLMTRNIAELPAIVELAHELGVSEVHTNHVFPVNEEMRAQSLVNNQELAATSIDRAVSAARRLGVRLEVGPLDQLTASNATAAPGERQLAATAGVVPGLEARGVGRESTGPSFTAAPEMEEKRRSARASSAFPQPSPGRRFPKRHPAIWVCDYVWNHPYVHIGGEVRPCCVDGPPVIGGLEESSFDGVWNNDALVAMRQLMAAKDPVPVCRGCQHIQEVSDPKAIAKWLQGRSPPDPAALPEVPELLSRPASTALSL